MMGAWRQSPSETEVVEGRCKNTGSCKMKEAVTSMGVELIVGFAVA